MTKEQAKALGLSTMDDPFGNMKKAWIEVPIFMYHNPDYKMYLGTVRPLSWNEAGQVERFKPNQFDKEDEFGEEFNWGEL